MADPFDIRDDIFTTVPPAEYAEVHRDGDKWPKSGNNYRNTTRLLPGDWSALIAQFRGLRSVEGFDYDALPSSSPFFLSSAIASAVAAAVPPNVLSQIPELADTLADNPELIALLAEAGAGVPHIDGPLHEATIDPGHKYVVIGGTMVYRKVDVSHPALGSQDLPSPGFEIPGDWGATAGWTIVPGLASKAPGNANDIDVPIPAGWVAGDKILTRVTVTRRAAGGFFIATGLVGEGGYSPTITSVGTHEVVSTFGSYAFYNVVPQIAFDGDISRIEAFRLPAGSVKSVDGAWWAPVTNSQRVFNSIADLSRAGGGLGVPYLNLGGRSDFFPWTDSDLSDRLLGPDINGTASSTTEIITAPDHKLLTGMAVINSGATAFGVTTNRIWWPIVPDCLVMHFSDETTPFTVGQRLTDSVTEGYGTIVKIKKIAGSTRGQIWLENPNGLIGQGNPVTDPLGGAAIAQAAVPLEAAPGMPVIATAVVPHPDKFKLALSYEDAQAGTALNLSASGAITLKRHFDPLQGVIITPDHDKTGASGGHVRASLGRENEKSAWWGHSETASASDNDKALQAALNWRGVAQIARGEFQHSRKIQVRGMLRVLGLGRGATSLCWYGAASHGFKAYMSNDRTESSRLCDFAMRTDHTGTGSVGIHVDQSERLVGTLSNGTTASGTIERIQFTNATGGATGGGWWGCVWLQDPLGWGVNWLDCNGNFLSNEADIQSFFGFRATSSADGAGSVVLLSNSSFFYCQQAAYVDTIEGFGSSRNTMVACVDGLVGRVTADKVCPHWISDNDHFNTTRYGIDLRKYQQVFITNFLPYQRPVVVSAGIAVYLENVIDGFVENGLVVKNGNFEQFYRAVVLGPGTRNVEVDGIKGRDVDDVVLAMAGSYGNKIGNCSVRKVSPSAVVNLYTDESDGANSFPFGWTKSNEVLVSAAGGAVATVVDLPLSNLTKGTRLRVTGSVRVAKGATAGKTEIYISRLSGATVSFGPTGGEDRSSFNSEAGSIMYEKLETYITTTNDALTLTLRLHIYSLRSSASIAIGEGHLSAVEV